MDFVEGGRITKFSIKVVNHNPTDNTTLCAISLAVNRRSESTKEFMFRFLHQFANVERRPERWSPIRSSGHFNNIQRLFSGFVSPCRTPLLSN